MVDRARLEPRPEIEIVVRIGQRTTGDDERPRLLPFTAGIAVALYAATAVLVSIGYLVSTMSFVSDLTSAENGSRCHLRIVPKMRSSDAGPWSVSQHTL